MSSFCLLWAFRWTGLPYVPHGRDVGDVLSRDRRREAAASPQHPRSQIVLDGDRRPLPGEVRIAADSGRLGRGLVEPWVAPGVLPHVASAAAVAAVAAPSLLHDEPPSRAPAQELLHHLGVQTLGRQVHRSVAPGLFRVQSGVAALLKEQPEDGEVAMLGRQVERRPAVVIHDAGPSPLPQQVSHGVQAALLRRQVQRGAAFGIGRLEARATIYENLSYSELALD